LVPTELSPECTPDNTITIIGRGMVQIADLGGGDLGNARTKSNNDKARRIATNIARLPQSLGRDQQH
jgi:hypothetical protein